MAKETRLNPLFLNTDKAYVFHVKNEAETAAIDITGWALSFMIKRDKTNADASALVSKATSSGIVIAGTYNADPAVNTQRATVTVLDTDTDDLSSGRCPWEFKRTDDGFEAVLGFGTVDLTKSVHKGS